MRTFLLSSLLLAACGGSRPATTVSAPPPTGPAIEAKPDVVAEVPIPAKPTKPVTNLTLAAIGLDPAALDRKVDPCADFYQFACGGWIAKTEIAADKPAAMRSFIDIEDKNLEYEKTILEGLRGKATTPVEKQLAAYYGSCMDEPAIEKLGLAPFKPQTLLIAGVKDARSLTGAIAQLRAAGFPMLFSLSPAQDAADARNVIADLEQGGLGLPDRDYYVKDDAQSKELRVKYETHVAEMLVEMGRKPAAAKTEAASVVALETAIAKVSKDNVARRDPRAMYNRLDRDGVAKAMPHFDWTTFWKTVGLDKAKEITVGSPDFLAGVDALLTSTRPEVWRAYLTYHLSSQIAAYAPKHFKDVQFKFASALTGQPELPPRWKRCASDAEATLGDSLGQLFVRDRFPGDSKTAADAQVAAINDAMRANLAALPWMDATTKSRAADKLKVMTYQIGFPRKWRDYTFKLDPKTWAANAIAANRFEAARQLAKIGKPVDKDDWQMTVPQVNAYYDPQLNGMVFPAGILQPPFYSVTSAVQVNLGGIGMVMGHELTHGFDDQGAQYDAVGNLTNWWQPDTETQFKSRTQCVSDQYSKYEIAGGGHVNGALTLGENIADIGGIKLAFTAYHQLRSTAPDAMVADGFTEDQQFFLSFGQSWCAKLRPDFEKLLVATDPHSPAQWRVNGTLQATPEFAKAFGCKAGSKMLPAKQCTVW